MQSLPNFVSWWVCDLRPASGNGMTWEFQATTADALTMHCLLNCHEVMKSSFIKQRMHVPSGASNFMAHTQLFSPADVACAAHPLASKDAGCCKSSMEGILGSHCISASICFDSSDCRGADLQSQSLFSLCYCRTSSVFVVLTGTDLRRDWQSTYWHTIQVKLKLCLPLTICGSSLYMVRRQSMSISKSGMN